MFFLMQNIFVILAMQHGCHANLYWGAGSVETWRVITYRAGERFVNTMVN